MAIKSFREFIRRGGTKVARTPEEAREMGRAALIEAGVPETRFRGGPSGGVTRVPPPARPTAVPEEPIPEPTPTVSPQIQATREAAQRAAVIREQAREKGISPAVQETRERAAVMRGVRAEAKKRGIKIRTPAQATGFVQQLRAEEEQARDPLSVPSPSVDVTGYLSAATEDVGVALSAEQTEMHKGIPIYDITATERGVTRPATGEEVKFFSEQQLTTTPRPTALGEKLIGIDIIPRSWKLVEAFKTKDVKTYFEKDITFAQVAHLSAEKGKLPGKVLAELIPKTPTEVLVAGGLVSAAVIAPPIVGAGISGAIGVVGTKQALTPLRIEQRIAGGIVGIGGVAGAVGPPIVTRVKLYSEIKTYAGKLPKPQQAEFLAVFKEAKTLRSISPEVKPLDLARLKIVEKYPKAGPIVKDFLIKKKLIVGGSLAQQPQLETGIGGTKRPGDLDLYVSNFLKSEGTLGKRYAVNLAKELRTEGVPAYARSGKIAVEGEKFIEFHPYKTYLRPNIQQVTPIYYPARAGLTKTPEGVKVLRLDIQAPRKVVGYYLEPVMTGKVRLKDLPAYLSIRKSLMITRAKQAPLPFSYMMTTKDLYVKDSPFNMLGATTPIRGGGAVLKAPTKYPSTKYPSYPSYRGVSFEYGYYPTTKTIFQTYTSVTYKPQIPPPVITTTYPQKDIPRVPSPSIPSYVKTQPQKGFQYLPKSKPPITPPPYVPTPIYRILPSKTPRSTQFDYKPKYPKKKKDLYSVFLRRFGKFKPIGTGLGIREAQEIGRTSAAKTLAATYNIEGPSPKQLRTPVGFYAKPTKKGLLFIEKPKFRLSKVTEVKEIQLAKRRKRR